MLGNYLKYYSILSLWGFQVFMLYIYGNGLSQLSTQYTIPYRAIVVFFALFIFIKFRKLIMIGNSFTPIIIFYILLILRCIYELTRSEILIMGTDASTYLLRWLSIVVFPSLPFFLVLKYDHFKSVLKGFKISIYLFAIFFFLYYSDYISLDYRLLKHSDNIAYDYLISPLIFGYVGLFGLSIFISEHFITNSFNKKNIIFVIFCIYLLIYSSSRGPIISSIFLIVYAIFKSSINSHKKFIYFLVSVLLIIYSISILKISNYSTIDRFIVLIDNFSSNNFDELGSYRFSTWKRALDQYFENPFFGSGIEEEKSKYVAHNAIIEAFSSTGIIGGILFLSILYRAIKHSIYLIKIKSNLSFLSFLFIGTLITSLFSTSIFSPQIWFFIILLIKSKNHEFNRRH